MNTRNEQMDPTPMPSPKAKTKDEVKVRVDALLRLVSPRLKKFFLLAKEVLDEEKDPIAQMTLMRAMDPISTFMAIKVAMAEKAAEGREGRASISQWADDGGKNGK